MIFGVYLSVKRSVRRSSRGIYQRGVYGGFERENRCVLINAADGFHRILHRNSPKYAAIRDLLPHLHDTELCITAERKRRVRTESHIRGTKSI